MSEINTILYREVTANSTAPLNHKRQFCDGHAKHFSEGQFSGPEAQFCKQCVLRNVSEVKKTKRRP